MRNTITISLALLLAACGSATAQDAPSSAPALAAPSGVYTNDPAHTSLTWKIGHLGLSDFTARVSQIDIELDFNAADLSRSSVTATIGAASFDTGYPYDDKDFNAEIASPMIMNADEFPSIRFASTKVIQTSPSSANIEGELTMMGVTQPVILTADYHGSTDNHPFANVPAIGFSARATIDRTQFGNTFLSGQGLSDEVTILIEAEFLKQAP